MKPSLEAFWALHDVEYYKDEIGCERMLYPQPDPRFVPVGSLGKIPGEMRHKWCIVKDTVDDEYWGVLIYSPGSWDDSYKALHVQYSEPTKLKSIPRQVTVYDWSIDNG